MEAVPQRILPKPGITRDATRLESETCIDGEWVRWDRGRPRKIGGYQRLNQQLTGIPRGISGFNASGKLYLHVGSRGALDQLKIESDGTSSLITDRLPAGFTVLDENVWQFTTIYDSVTTAASIFAHCAPNALNQDSTVQRPVYVGDLTATADLTAVTASSVSGGIFAAHPYLVLLDDAGRVIWSVPGTPTDLSGTGSGEARITDQKLIAGRQMRGSQGNSPSALIWSIDRLCRMQFIGGAAIWSFDEITETTLLSNDSIIELDGVYYWPGIDRFNLFSGVARELPNPFSIDFFFDQMNWTYRHRTFGFANKRRGELWWCFPRGTSTECNHAVIMNIRDGSWYDTPLPNSGRSGAFVASSLRTPLMTGVNVGDTGGYKLWAHEIGVDEIDGQTTKPIKSYFETPDITLLKSPQPRADRIEVHILEPDFRQSGDLNLTVIGNANAKSQTIGGDEVFVIPEGTDLESKDQIVRLKEVRRQMRFRVESNTAGGDYVMGAVYAHIKKSDGGVTS